MKEKTKGKYSFMLVKTITAVLGSLLCIVVFLKTPLWGTAALLSFAAGMMGFELSVSTGLINDRFLQIISIFFAVSIPWLIYFKISQAYLILILFVCVAVCFFYALFIHNDVEVSEIITAVFSGFVFPLILSLFIVISSYENGRKLVLLPFVIAWMCDTFSQLVGMKFGKHKLIEKISPNKTVEGFFGGILGSVVGVLIYALILIKIGVSVRFGMLILIAVLGALFSVFGDLSLSFIKRKCEIKDFGRLLPEHGGILDRFDSVLFVLPLCTVMSQYIIK